ncbi:hypothetical protein UFOVP84_143 [uncultured Caudovirales phage]|uniref:Uncharacterized protein n=1 Tax=uncultured Caudovirales phage TaxID=2100421 RepID=A0A6J5L461_9CAUD|nr:hypothetical protein UFOVP84_143 [uncultured Caudovirales phage]
MIEKLNNTNFILYCMKHYDNPQCTTIKEFEEDLNRILYLQKLLTRYINNKEDLRERLILNHIIVLYNLFGEATTNILFYKLDKEYWNILITFLIYLNRMPDFVPQYGIIASDFELDDYIISKLREI